MYMPQPVLSITLLKFKNKQNSTSLKPHIPIRSRRFSAFFHVPFCPKYMNSVCQPKEGLAVLMLMLLLLAFPHCYRASQLC
jgi:hypothetical protein